MFSGLVQEVGTLERTTVTAAGHELRVACAFEDLRPGESVAVNGVCLTVREADAGWFTVAAGAQTLARTAIAGWKEGKKLNLERALRLSDRIGGHLVQGHVDGVGAVASIQDAGDVLLLDFSVPAGLSELFVPLGSIAIDGVSLTINALPRVSAVQVGVIEYTRRHTTLGSLRSGDPVHVEADAVAKYVRQLVAPYLERLSGPEQV